jgi:hypothetical protein
MKNKTNMNIKSAGKKPCILCFKKSDVNYYIQNPRFIYEWVSVCKACFLRKDFWKKFGEYIDGTYGEK